jgi:predicted dinucleotide-binding enzyme
MKIAVIGSGNVGGALAMGWANKGHEIVIGARNPQSPNVKKLIFKNANIKVKSLAESAKDAEVILIAADSSSVKEIVKQLGDVKNKVIIDAMNSIAAVPAGFANSFEALKSLTNCQNLVKCFNTTGFENMTNPTYGNTAADMFMAGDSEKGKQIAKQLAKDIGFAECYDLGGDHRVEMLEQLAMIWVNLALIQKQGRNIAFKILKR